MEEKRAEPTVIIQPPAYGQDVTQPGWKKSGNVKLLIIAVTTVVLVGVVMTGFILAFKHHTEATEKALSSIVIERIVDHDGKETIESDDQALTMLYTVSTEEGNYQVLYDYNKNIRVASFDDQCIVSPLNSSDVDPKTAYEKGLQPEDGHITIFERDNVPIRDQSFLGGKGQDMCDRKLVYWGFRTCGDNVQGLTILPHNSTDLSSRNKRAAAVVCKYPLPPNLCCNKCGYYTCSSCWVKIVRMYFSNFVLCDWYFRPGCGTSGTVYHK